MNEKNHLFSNHALKMLLIPLVAEQFLTSLMGTADSMMVSNVGSAAISAVSLVDSINVLVIQAFAALSAGGTIVCSQYTGRKNLKKATESARAAPSGGGLHSVLVMAGLSGFPDTASSAGIWKSGRGGYGCVEDLLPYYLPVLPFYRPL